MKAVLFDLGNTLVRYYSRAEAPGILTLCLRSALACLQRKEMPDVPSLEKAQESFSPENHESKDFRVRPLEERLTRSFGLPPAFTAGADMTDLCAAFVKPFFERAQRYDDSIPVLQELRGMNMKLGIITNLAWGSPARLWREEISRHGLASLVDAVVTCRDVGWRKPARVIFEHTAAQVGVEARECVFVGDDVRWDYEGAKGAGMTPLLIVREGAIDAERETVPDLKAVLECVKAGK